MSPKKRTGYYLSPIIGLYFLKNHLILEFYLLIFFGITYVYSLQINGQFFFHFVCKSGKNISKSEADNRHSRIDLIGVYYSISLRNKGMDVFVPRKYVIETYLIINVVCRYKYRRGLEKMGSNGHYSFPKIVSH